VEIFTENTSIKDIIFDGESHTLEFKQLARWSHGTDRKRKSEQIIVKSVAGFMNSEGEHCSLELLMMEQLQASKQIMRLYLEGTAMVMSVSSYSLLAIGFQALHKRYVGFLSIMLKERMYAE